MARTKLSDTIARDKDLTVWELKTLYRNNVDNNINEEALNLFKGSELKRHIAIILYRRNIFDSLNNRASIVQRIAEFLFVHPNTVKSWCPTNKKRKRR